MNNLEIERILRGFPVMVCAADQITIQHGRFVICNTDTSGGRGKHWVTFYFNVNGPYEFFDSLGKPPNYYGFQHLLDRPYWMNCDQIQDSHSNVCGQYCIFYVMNSDAGKTMKNIVQPFNIHDRTMNDDYVVNFVNKQHGMHCK